MLQRSIWLPCILSATLSALTSIFAVIAIRERFETDAAVVRAWRFEVVDDAGNVRGYFGGPTANDSLTLVDANGIERISLRVLAEGTAVLYMADGGNRGRAGMFVTNNGDATLQFYDENGRVNGIVAGEPRIP